jgi:YidC/Oxa1 family membrane protein insertase
MNILSYIFTELIYRPLFNVLVMVYNAVPGHDIGMAIIILTIMVRLLLYKMNSKSIKSQRELQEIQPRIKEIQQKYKDNKEKQAQELMAVYQKYKVNPFSGCLPLLIQFPIIIALYYVFLNGFHDGSLNALYSFVSNPGHLNTVSFRGLIDLAKPNVYMALSASVLQYFQTSSLMKVSGNNKKTNDGKAEEEKTPEEKAQDFAQALSQNMMYAMPVITFLFGMTLPSGLALYWSVTTLFAIAQQYLIIRKRRKSAPAQS